MIPSVVLFDLDDTLLQHREAVEAAATVALKVLDAAIEDETIARELERWRELEEHHYHRYLAGEAGFEEQRRARAREFAAPYGLELDDEAASAWWVRYLEDYREAWVLHDDALASLDDLTERFPGVRFGLITNGELDFQMSKVDAVELAARVDHVVASGDFGTAKPDPAIFRHACALFDAEPAECAYVGDRFRTDAMGAVTAGLTGVWLDRRGTALPDADTADLGRVLRISSLSELGRAITEA